MKRNNCHWDLGGNQGDVRLLMKALSTMKKILSILLAVICYSLTLGNAFADESERTCWQEQSIEYAKIMSRVKWTPVADSMMKRGE